MFSQAFEIVLTVAYREATSRRHTHLTLEHLLYALAHDHDGERILAACGADLPKLAPRSRQVPEGVGRAVRPRPAEGAGADARVPARAADGGAARAERAARQEVQSGDVLAATLQQNKSYAAQLLADQGITRLDVLDFITHGISEVPSRAAPPQPTTTRRCGRRPGRARPRAGARSARRLRAEPDRPRAAPASSTR